jgi:hypothetical protein
MESPKNNKNVMDSLENNKNVATSDLSEMTPQLVTFSTKQ